ncbi:MAG TPA: hypothetical protein VGC13_14925 [Longimicrobium sp.]|jgi:hypothetical protein|uniref:hypothetical protein n=1 Tax=Longimicrobium sp. TaxID=2029185 RepID=UPI002ED77764
MTLPVNPNDTEATPDPGGNSAAGIVKAAVSPLAAILTAWGKMPRVRTLLEYLARKIVGWTIVCSVGLYAGGRLGTVAVYGAVGGLLLETGVAAWNERRRLQAESGKDAGPKRSVRRGGGKVLMGTPDVGSGEPDA